MHTQPRLFSVLPRVGLGLLVPPLMAKISRAETGLLPERVAKAAQERIDAGTYQTLVFGVLADGKSEVITKETKGLENGTHPMETSRSVLRLLR